MYSGRIGLGIGTGTGNPRGLTGLPAAGTVHLRNADKWTSKVPLYVGLMGPWRSPAEAASEPPPGGAGPPPWAGAVFSQPQEPVHILCKHLPGKRQVGCSSGKSGRQARCGFGRQRRDLRLLAGVASRLELGRDCVRCVAYSLSMGRATHWRRREGKGEPVNGALGIPPLAGGCLGWQAGIGLLLSLCYAEDTYSQDRSLKTSGLSVRPPPPPLRGRQRRQIWHRGGGEDDRAEVAEVLRIVLFDDWKLARAHLLRRGECEVHEMNLNMASSLSSDVGASGGGGRKKAEMSNTASDLLADL
ncbi:hypothetical protein FB45DRAFT_861165 [Roridomyces roridus]|uniref:Uncharacterized protein n=1 Tax=Roridomyces roridus TaxID=1738132 RepID=A0AAD7CA10_9AGAR|nr:hypothetical protein FB45DRAFT_861165 [Roridomyces roridus]